MKSVLVKILAPLTFTMALMGCSEDLPLVDPTPGEGENGKPSQSVPTDAISFTLNEPVTSRAYFESRFKVKWTHGDQILIYSPDVNQGKINVYDEDGNKTGEEACPNSKKYGYYSVNEWNESIYDPDHNDIVPVGNTEQTQKMNSLYWSTGHTAQYWGELKNFKAAAGTGEGWHRFFAAYPAERVVNVPSGVPSLSNPNDPAIFTMDYYTNQYNTIDKDAIDYSFDNQGGYLTYNGVPDMKNCYLMAMRELLYNKDHVLLDFDPIMTILDVKVTSGGYEVPIGVVNRTRITGISVIMTHGMTTGNIEYDLSKGTRYEEGYREVLVQTPEEFEGKGVLKEGSYNNKIETVFVGVKWRDGSGVMQDYIDLGENESVNLTAFLPPIPKEETVGYKIKVHTVGATNYVVALNGDKLSEATLGGTSLDSFEGLTQQSRVEIKLPKISIDDPIKYNKWMTYLDPSTPLYNLCVPGYRFTSSNNYTDAQMEELVTKLAKQGVRFFDLTDIDIYHFVHKVIYKLYDLQVTKGELTEPVFIESNRIGSGDGSASGSIYNDQALTARLYSGNLTGTLGQLSAKGMMIWGRLAISSGDYYNKWEKFWWNAFNYSENRLDNVDTSSTSLLPSTSNTFNVVYSYDWQTIIQDYNSQKGGLGAIVVKDTDYNKMTAAEQDLFFQSIINLNFKTH